MQQAVRQAGSGPEFALYERPLSAARTGPLYNAFPYPTKISPEAIALFIATHSAPGDTILDAFGGSGTTALGALLCERPTETMLAQASKLGLECEWGPRNTFLYEVGVLGSFVSNVLTHPPDPLEFRTAAAALIKEAQSQVGDLYEALSPQGSSGSIRHIIWSDVIQCPHCSAETTYWAAAVRREPLALSKDWVCEYCERSAQLELSPRVYEDTVDVFGQRHEIRKRLPVEVHGACGSTRWSRLAREADREVAQRATLRRLPGLAPNVKIAWGDLYRAGYHRGIERLHQLYTPRNFLVVATCLEIARKYPEPLRSSLELLVLSYNAAHATLMTRVVVKSGQKDFVLTSAQSGVLYVSGLPVEKNVLHGLARKARTLEAAFQLVSGTRGRVEVINATSEKLHLATESVDYVFTDPPFGAYIPYAELNQVNELWLGSVTNRKLETIVSPASGKTERSYSESLRKIFSEVGRVLKPDGKATVVFHSAHSAIWEALTRALRRSGLVIHQTSILDKEQPSFKQVVSSVSVKGDPLMLLTKDQRARSTKTAEAVLDEVLQGVERGADLRELYSKYAAACLGNGLSVQLDAEVFQRLVAERLRVAA